MKKLLNTLITVLMLVHAGSMHAQVNGILVASSYKSGGISACKNLLSSKGYTYFDQDLCDGLGLYSYYVYLGYITGSADNSMTGLLLVEGDRRDHITYEGKTYYPVSGLKESGKSESDGNLNQYNGSKTKLYLYQTKDGNKDWDTQILWRIELVYDSSQPGLVQLAKVDNNNNVTGLSGAGDLNSQGSKRIYLRAYWHKHTGFELCVSDATGEKYRCTTCDFVTRYYDHYFPGPTFSDDNSHKYVCQSCDYTKYESHSYSSVIAGDEHHSRVCDVCKYEMARPHDNSINTTYYKVDEVYHMGVCTDCYYSTVSKHRLKLQTVLVQADCCHEGEEQYVCETDGCGAVIVRKVARKPHSYVNGICNNEGCLNRYQPAQDDASGVYSIGNAGNLLWLANLVNSGMTGISAQLTADIMVPAGLMAEPLGKSMDLAYNGQLEGNNHRIIGLDGPLFGYVGTGFNVSGVHLRSSSIERNSEVSAMVLNNKGLIYDCTVADVSLKSQASSAAGALCAYNIGEIRNCSVGNDVTLNVSGSRVGGICGINNGTVADCTSLAHDAQGKLLPLVGSGDADVVESEQTKGAIYLQSLAVTKSGFSDVGTFISGELEHFRADAATSVTTPGISILSPADSAYVKSAWYDLNGRVIGFPTTGTVGIRDGRKYLGMPKN